MSRIVAVQTQINALATASAAACLLGLTALLLTEVALRALGHPVFGVQEVSEMAMILVIFGALAEIEAKAGQIRVDLLADRFGATLSRSTAQASAVLGLLIWSALAWALIDAGALAALLGAASNLLQMPRAPFHYGMAALALLAALASLTRLVTGGPHD